MLKRIISALIASMLVFSAVMMTSADTLSDLQNQQAALEQEAAEYQAIIDEKQGEIEEQQEYIDALTSNIAVVNEEISVMRSKIDVYDTQIAEKTETINELNIQAEENMNILRQRLKAIYIAGDASTLEIIMGAKDFTDFVDKVQLVESLSEYDANLIDDIEGQLDGISEEIESLNEDKAALEEENIALEEKQSELNTMLAENQELLAGLYADQSEMEELLHSNEESQSEVEQEIQAYYERLEAEKEAQKQQEQQSGSSSSSDVIVGTGNYVWPVPGHYTLSSSWAEDRGYAHGGIDIAGSGIMGATVVAADSGTVITSYNGCAHNWGKYGSCGCGGGFGNYVWIDHGNGKATIYAHLSSTAVYEGQYVTAGEVVGYIGSTGYSTGPHLHFECRNYGTKYDPMSEY